MNRTFIIQFEIKNDAVLKERVKALADRWMNFFPGSIVIASTMLAKEIYDKISVGFEKERILIIEINPKNHWGVMPQEAWDWLKK